MKNIILAGINSKYIHTNLAIYYLRAVIEKYTKDTNVTVLEWGINTPINTMLSDIYRIEPEYVFFSVYIWNKEIVFKNIRTLKKILPDVKIAVGGPEVSYNGYEIMNCYSQIDFIFMGEGENGVIDFFTLDISLIKGVYYRSDGEIKYNGDRVPIADLNSIPFPYTDENISEFKNKIIYYESSRGCPFGCIYCLSSINKGVRFFDIERVKSELDFFMKHNVKLVKFVDRTFNTDPERYLAIWTHIINNYNGITTFHFEIAAEYLSEKSYDILSDAQKGAIQFEIGIQSTNQKTLSISRRKADLDKIRRNIMMIPENINIHLDLIAGLPEEDFISFASSFNYTITMRPQMLQLGFLKILHGTAMEIYAKDNGYKYSDFPPYEFISNTVLSYGDICRLKDIEKCVDIFYNSGKFSNLMFKITDEADPFSFFDKLASYMRDNGIIQNEHQFIQYYGIVVDFIKCSDENDDYLSALKSDYFTNYKRELVL